MLISGEAKELKVCVFTVVLGLFLKVCVFTVLLRLFLKVHIQQITQAKPSQASKETVEHHSQ